MTLSGAKSNATGRTFAACPLRSFVRMSSAFVRSSANAPAASRGKCAPSTATRRPALRDIETAMPPASDSVSKQPPWPELPVALGSPCRADVASVAAGLPAARARGRLASAGPPSSKVRTLCVSSRPDDGRKSMKAGRNFVQTRDQTGHYTSDRRRSRPESPVLRVTTVGPGV